MSTLANAGLVIGGAIAGAGITLTAEHFLSSSDDDSKDDNKSNDDSKNDSKDDSSNS